MNHDYRLTMRALRRLVEAAGFEVLSTQHRYVLPRNLVDMPRLRRAVNRHAAGLYRLDAALAALPLLRPVSTSLNLVARKPPLPRP